MARLLRPVADRGEGKEEWGFVLLPRPASEVLPRRGRVTVEGTINGRGFRATLEPDGQLGHWLKVDGGLRSALGVEIGDELSIEFAPAAEEPEPEVPDDLRQALEADEGALAVWRATTTLARVDWVHWISSAKLAKTRAKRVADACRLLGEGQRRVCCFDPSGFYSKAFSAPEEAP